MSTTADDVPSIDNQTLLDTPLGELIALYNVGAMNEFDRAFTLYVWQEQLLREKESCRNEYPNKADYDARVKAINNTLHTIDSALDDTHTRQQSKPSRSLYERRVESFEAWASTIGDVSKVDTIQTIHERLKSFDNKVWSIKFPSFQRDFWQLYTKTRPDLSRKRGR